MRWFHRNLGGLGVGRHPQNRAGGALFGAVLKGSCIKKGLEIAHILLAGVITHVRYGVSAVSDVAHEFVVKHEAEIGN